MRRSGRFRSVLSSHNAPEASPRITQGNWPPAHRDERANQAHALWPDEEFAWHDLAPLMDQLKERFKYKKMRDEVLMLGIIHPKEPGDPRIFRDDKAKALYIFKHLTEMTWPSSLSDGEKQAQTNKFDQNWETGMYRDWLDVHTSEVLEQHRRHGH